MEFKIECPWCNQHYSVDESFFGQTVKCSVCEKEFTVRKQNVSASEQQSRFIQQPKSFPQYNRHPQYSTQPPQYGQPLQHGTPSQQICAPPVAESDKSRNTFALLGFFLGCFGVHQFYIGNIGNGIATILANFLCSTPVVIFFCGIELLSTTTDNQKLPLKEKDSPVAIVLGVFLILFGIIGLLCVSIPLTLSTLNK